MSPFVTIAGVTLSPEAFLVLHKAEASRRDSLSDAAVDRLMELRIRQDRARLAIYAKRDELDYAVGALLDEILEYHRPDAEHEAAWRAYVYAVRDSLVKPLEAA